MTILLTFPAAGKLLAKLPTNSDARTVLPLPKVAYKIFYLLQAMYNADQTYLYIQQQVYWNKNEGSDHRKFH